MNRKVVVCAFDGSQRLIQEAKQHRFMVKDELMPYRKAVEGLYALQKRAEDPYRLATVMAEDDMRQNGPDVVYGVFDRFFEQNPHWIRVLVVNFPWRDQNFLDYVKHRGAVICHSEEEVRRLLSAA